jgi:transcriptional regulator with XRE-family HTH domain
MMQEKFNHLLASVRPGKKLVEELHELLGLSTHAIYRRIRGESNYTAEEIFKIAGYYGLSLDSLIGGGKDFISFQRTPFIKNENDFEAYLEASLAQLQGFASKKDCELFYSAKDIPIYYQFKYSHLGAFKMKVWLNALYNSSSNGSGLAKISERMMELSKELYKTYMSIPSTEIWNDTTVLSLYKQLEYYWISGQISDDEALLILEDTEKMLDLVFLQASKGQRTGESLMSSSLNVPFRMYYHDILIMDNHIYTRSTGEKSLYIAWAGLNFIKTTDPQMIREMEYFIERQHSRSLLISSSSEKERHQWKRKASEQLQRLRELILSS